jgi:hypothetical protein
VPADDDQRQQGDAQKQQQEFVAYQHAKAISGGIGDFTGVE